MYLAYLDDSETKDKAYKWQVMAAILIPDKVFNTSELLTSFVIGNLISADKLDKFQEFHACELFGGYGVFEGIAQQERFSAMESLLRIITTASIKIAYGAVNIDYLRQQDYASASPQDMAFRLCIKGLQEWMSDLHLKNFREADIASGQLFWESPLALLIADEAASQNKKELQKSFRELRKKVRPPTHDTDGSMHFHDDMYFGDSKYSLGIQLADLCAFLIAKHLEKKIEAQLFYNLIAGQIVFSKTHPSF